MTAVAITDHGNMFGAYEFQKVVTGAGLKPIVDSRRMLPPPPGSTDRMSVIDLAITLQVSEDDKDLEPYSRCAQEVRAVGPDPAPDAMLRQASPGAIAKFTAALDRTRNSPRVFCAQLVASWHISLFGIKSAIGYVGQR